MSDGLAIGGNARTRATSVVGVACLALLTVAAAYALSAAPALATGQALLRAPASWLVAPLGARPAHLDALASHAAARAEPLAHVFVAAVPTARLAEPAGGVRPIVVPQALITLIPALLVAVALALAR